ncbi:MAG: 3-hydroxylacyl-ACP dehydratase [Burkholderiales bacterium]|jgi:predicted hotdog family 3-hydroxylacyl-ACP dehydratase|nr:3-hydroxylacyl-ACP dehydratase [Burkholderiales bacterium]
MTLPDLSQLIPQTKTMFLLDRLLSVDETTACCEVRITPQSLFFERGGVGSWVAIEYMAQTVAAHAGYLDFLSGIPPQLGLLLGTRRFQCSRAQLSDGTHLIIEATRIFAADNGMGSYDCTVKENGAMVAEATLTAFKPHDQHLLWEGLTS